MALAFRRVTSAPLQDFDAAAPDGAVIGIVGDNASGADRLLELASGPARPASGSVEGECLLATRDLSYDRGWSHG